MKQPLEQHLTETLEARAHAVRDVPDLGERVVTRGRQVRRRRRVYGGLAVVVAVATAVATPTLLVDPDARRTPAPPVTTPTSSPSPSPAAEPLTGRQQVRRFLNTAAVGPGTEVPFAALAAGRHVAVGRHIYVGDERFTLPYSGLITSVHRADGGYLVRRANTATATGRLGLIGERPYRDLAVGSVGTVAVDRSQGLAAWSVFEGEGATRRSRLTLVELPGGTRVAEQVIGPWWHMVGFAENGLVIARYMDQARPSAALWDWETSTVTALGPDVERWGTLDYSSALHTGGSLLVHSTDGGRCTSAVLTTAPEVPLWERCDIDMVSAAVSADGSLVAVSEADGVEGDALHLLDGATGESLQTWTLPSGSYEPQVVWEDAQRILFTIGYTYQGRPESMVIRCTVGASDCERVPTPEGEFIDALGHP